MDGYIEHHHSIPASSFGTLIQSVKAGERWGVGQHMSRFNGRPPASRRVPPWLALFLVASATTCHRSAHRQRTLPDTPLVIGYAHDCQSGKVDLAIEGGVNVVVWAFLHMTASTHHDQVSPLRHHTAVNGLHPSIDTSHLDLQCIRACRRRWEARGIEVTHLAAFGGWNGPHVDEHYSGAAWFAAFEDMNTHHGDGDSTLFDGGRPPVPSREGEWTLGDHGTARVVFGCTGRRVLLPLPRHAPPRVETWPSRRTHSRWFHRPTAHIPARGTKRVRMAPG